MPAAAALFWWWVPHALHTCAESTWGVVVPAAYAYATCWKLTRLPRGTLHTAAKTNGELSTCVLQLRTVLMYRTAWQGWVGRGQSGSARARRRQSRAAIALQINAHSTTSPADQHRLASASRVPHDHRHSTAQHCTAHHCPHPQLLNVGVPHMKQFTAAPSLLLSSPLLHTRAPILCTLATHHLHPPLLPRMKQSPYLFFSCPFTYSSVCSIAMFM